MRPLIVFILFLFLLQSLCAQSPAFFSNNVENGAPSNEVYCLLEDKNGYIWIGCDAGVYRFNGINYEHFTSPKLSARAASGLTQAPSGRIYGYNFNRQLFFIENEQVHVVKEWDKPVNGIAADNQGVIWISSPDGAFKLDEKNLKISEIESDLHLTQGNRIFTSHAIADNMVLSITWFTFNVKADIYTVYHGGFNGGSDYITCNISDTIVLYGEAPASYDASVFPAATLIGTNTTYNYYDSVTMYVIQGGETSIGFNQVISQFPNPPMNNAWSIYLTINTSCIVNIPDANFKSYLVGNTAINTNGDTEIQCSEASAFTGTINCSSQNISDLTGIEYFVNLTVLYCNVNSLTTLDLSANISLTDLGCQQNQLTNLNISQNTQLINLGCFFNELSVLDVAANQMLEILDCGHNNLTALDISNHFNINQLYVNNNLLTVLNVANANNINFLGFDASINPNLTCIQVDDAAWSTTNWTSIDPTSSFSVDCSGINEISENSASFVFVHPNPAVSVVNIVSTASSSIEISSSNGIVIAKYEISGETTLDVSPYTPGIYFIRTAEGQTVKLIKE